MRTGLIVNVVIVAAAIGCGFAASQGPWTKLREQQVKTKNQIAEMRKSEAEREQLLRQEAHYRSSVGREELARGQGYLLPGEKVADPPPKAED